LPEPSTGAVPNIVAPSLKVTVPPGVPLPQPFTATAAVKVTAWPKLLGLMELTSVVLVASLFTPWGADPDEALKSASPL